MHRNPSRPLSPHLTIWRWGPHMLVSILHRVTGSGLATSARRAHLVAGRRRQRPAGLCDFTGWARSWIGIVVAVGLTWALFQHMLSGLRHFVMDIGAGFELRHNKFWALMTLAGSITLTALFWLYIAQVSL